MVLGLVFGGLGLVFFFRGRGIVFKGIKNPAKYLVGVTKVPVQSLVYKLYGIQWMLNTQTA